MSRDDPSWLDVAVFIGGMILALMMIIAAAGCHLHLHVGERHYHNQQKQDTPSLVDSLLEAANDGNAKPSDAK